MRPEDREDIRMKVRQCARIVVLNPVGAILLVRYSDEAPVDPGRPELLSYWVPPGGGISLGESFQRAAIRELEEETGIEVLEVGPQIWSRERRLMHHGELKRQLERYFVAWAKPSKRPLRNRTTEEKIEAIRWWTLEELRSSRDTFLPDNLVDLVAPIMAGDLPSVPIDIE